MEHIDSEEYRKLKMKFKKEIMTARELITFFDLCEGIAPPFDRYSRPTKLRRDIRRICELSEERLTLSQFTVEGNYFIQPNQHGIIFALLKSELLKKPKKAVGVQKTVQAIDETEEIIKEYLEPHQLKKIRESYEYIGAHQEVAMWDQLGSQIAVLLKDLHQMDVPMKYQNMQIAISELEGLCNSLASEVQQLQAGQDNIGQLDVENNGPTRTSLTNLRQRLIYMLAEDEGGFPTSPLSEEELGLVTYIADALFGMDLPDDEHETLYRAYQQAKDRIENDEVTQVLRKVAKVLDVDPTTPHSDKTGDYRSNEEYWYFTFEKIVKGQRARTIIDEKQKNIIMRIID